MPMFPLRGTARAIRHRKSWFSSSMLGCLNEVTWQLCGLNPLHYVADGAVLARRVHALQDQKQRAAILGV